MDLKCNDRVLKEMQMSFKLTNERKGTHSASIKSTWEPVQHMPKLIPETLNENQHKIKDIQIQTKGSLKLTTKQETVPLVKIEPQSPAISKNKVKQSLKSTNIKQELSDKPSNNFQTKRKSNISTANGIDKRVKLEQETDDSRTELFQPVANGSPSGKKLPTKATNNSSRKKQKVTQKQAENKTSPKLETIKESTMKPKAETAKNVINENELNIENDVKANKSKESDFCVDFEDSSNSYGNTYVLETSQMIDDDDYSESAGSENDWEQDSAGSENDWEQDSVGSEGALSESSGSEYSLDSDEDFFTKPEVFKCDQKKSRPPLEFSAEQEEERPWLMDWPKLEAEVTKIVVFDELMSEGDSESQDDYEESAEEEEEMGVESDAENEENEMESPVESSPETQEQLLPGSDDSLDMGLDQPLELEQLPPGSDDSLDMGINQPTDLEQPSSFPSELSIFENSLKTNNVLAVLKEDVEFYGTVVVTLLCGRITINGFKARPNEPLTIYSPKGVNWVAISPMCNKKPPKGAIDWHELNESFSRAQLDNIVENYDSQRDAIVLLQRNSAAQNLLSTFAKHMAENVFPLVNATNRPHYASEYLLNCLIQSVDPQRKLQVPRVWTKLSLQVGSRLMVTGGKGVGKSTLLRYLLNRHLEQFPRLLLIDLDIGQPELFLPQTISCSVVDKPLLGPGFFLNRQPEQAFVVGHVNVVMCAEQYARAVRQLLTNCHANASYAQMPWLINTMGYNKGFGLELMALLVDCVQPTDLVQIATERSINNFDEALDWRNLAKVPPIIYKASSVQSKHKLHQLRSALPQLERQERGWQMSAKDVRYANLLARLSTTLRGNAKHLTDCQPVQVALAALQIVHLTVEEYTREELIAGMEANLVYLCKRAAGEEPAECLGMGVVRAIDYEAQKLYLLPAMPLARLKHVNSLVLGGDMCLPQGFFKDQGTGVANNVPFVFIIDDNKSSKSIQQIYHRAPGFLGQPPQKNA